MAEWSIPSREEAEAYTQAYLSAQEAYYDEHIDDCCECCEHYENGICYLDIWEMVKSDNCCPYFEKH